MTLQGSSKTATQLRGFVGRLCDEEQYDDEEGRWTFQSGGDCFRCCDAAIKIARRFRGEVVGYWSATNPAASIGTRHGDGHDFALIENRYIVDYWAFRIGRLIDDPVLDLMRLRDRDRAALYGDARAWEVVPIESN
jgi:hypothetical protein